MVTYFQNFQEVTHGVAMKILIITDYSTPRGGAEIYCLKLRQLLREAGHDARLFSSTVDNQQHLYADFECWGTHEKVTNRLLQTFNPFALLKMHHILNNFKPDVVHLNLFLTQLSPALLLALKRVPVVYTAHLYKIIRNYVL